VAAPNDRRDQSARERLHAADERDLIADARDLAAITRDSTSDARDLAAPHREHAAEQDAIAADDRRSAALDREQAACERLHALVDRELLADALARAAYDELTGARARAAGLAELDNELDRCRRTSSPLALAYVDVIGLKTLNDTEGHAAGDRALATVGRVLLAGLRSYDHVVRWGGDEFLCLLPGVCQDEAERRVRHVQRVLEGGAEGLTVSMGVAERHAGESAAELVARADAALYRKRASRRP
jgi:diguanylate cyclase (GGDEF)-like protein